MPCYHPIAASQKSEGDQPKLWPPIGERTLALPCGKCIGCRTARATQWAQRCAHEAKMYPHNTFITLTYDDAHLPNEGHLDAAELQKFVKRLRQRRARDPRALAGDHNRSLRYFACGEYGERGGRPHYHAILFNCGFTDQVRAGKDLYESDTLRELWPWGANRIGEATPAAASYIAQYSLKKIGAGDFDADGVWRPAPFLRMSLKPAIGTAWLEKHASDLTHGYLVSGSRRHQIPRTYLEKLKKLQPHFAEEITLRIQQHRAANNYRNEHNDPERQKAAEIIHKRRKELLELRKL